MILFHVRTLAEVLFRCRLKVRVLSKVSPRYFGVGIISEHCAIEAYRQLLVCPFVIEVEVCTFSFECVGG